MDGLREGERDQVVEGAARGLRGRDQDELSLDLLQPAVICSGVREVRQRHDFAFDRSLRTRTPGEHGARERPEARPDEVEAGVPAAP